MGPYRPRLALALRTPVNQRSANGVGFPHRAGRYQPGESPFSSPARRSCKGVKVILIGEGGLSSPGGAGSTNPSQSAISQWGWGFDTLRGGIDPGSHRLRPRVVGFVHV